MERSYRALPRLKSPACSELAYTAMEHPVTPDGRYFVVRGRLWRCARPDLPVQQKAALVAELMHARRALRKDSPPAGRAAARRKVDSTKRALGERGEVWWDDGAPDYNRHLAINTPYSEWYSSLQAPGND